MSLEPDRIYLHDPYGCFEEQNYCENNTVLWSEDKISDVDYEYIRYPQLPGYDEIKKIAEDRAKTIDWGIGQSHYGGLYSFGFIEGMLWMKNKIEKQKGIDND